MVKQYLRETYELLLDSSSGDIEAYRELFERHSEKLYNFVYYLTYSREEAEDITGEAFIKVFQALQGRDVTSFNFQAYLYKTAKNLSLKAIARRKREGLTLEEAEDFANASIFSDPEKASLLSDQREKVKAAAGQLTEDQQAALLLKELENLPYGTIAEVLDSNPNAVGALLSRARLKFKEVYRMTHAQTEGIPDACEKITPLLSAYIDKEASPQERRMIEDHLASCPICNANLESMQEASTTYRSLIPILPMATFKVWSVAKGGLVGGKVAVGAAASVGAAGAGAAAAAGTTTATTTASTGIIAAIGSSLAYKVTAVMVAGLIAAGIGVGGYFTVRKVAFAKKQVPFLIGLKEQPATQKVEAAGLKCNCKYSGDFRTGNEVVTEQSLKPGTKVDNGTTVSLTMQDKEMAAARAEAEKKIGEANNALKEVQGMGIDTSDLAQPMQNAQAKHDGAKTIADLTGPTDSSVFWSDTVINGCNAKKRSNTTGTNTTGNNTTTTQPETGNTSPVPSGMESRSLSQEMLAGVYMHPTKGRVLTLYEVPDFVDRFYLDKPGAQGSIGGKCRVENNYVVLELGDGNTERWQIFTRTSYDPVERVYVYLKDPYDGELCEQWYGYRPN